MSAIPLPQPRPPRRSEVTWHPQDSSCGESQAGPDPSWASLVCFFFFFLALDVVVKIVAGRSYAVCYKKTGVSMLPPHALFPRPSKRLFLSLGKLLFSHLSTNVQMIGFVSKEKRESCFTRRSTAKHVTRAKERKQSRLIFAKIYSFVLLSLCTLHSPSVRRPPSQLFLRNNAVVNLFLFNS